MLVLSPKATPHRAGPRRSNRQELVSGLHEGGVICRCLPRHVSTKWSHGDTVDAGIANSLQKNLFQELPFGLLPRCAIKRLGDNGSASPQPPPSRWPLVARGPPWPIVVHRGPLWFTVAHCGSLWFTVAHRGSSWPIVAHCGPSWCIVAHFICFGEASDTIALGHPH